MRKGIGLFYGTCNHTIIHTPSWFADEAGEELQKDKEEKGTYNVSDILNAYGFTYARLYAEIEQRYENGNEQWFGLGGEPLTKEKEIEELNKAYESAVDWATKCAEVMVGIHWCWSLIFRRYGVMDTGLVGKSE